MNADQQLRKKGLGVKKKKGTTASSEYQFIENRKDLIALGRALESASVIAVDMEADSMYHYREKVCLVQVYAENIHAVIDTIKLNDLSPLRSVFAHCGIAKILHGADYDIRSLYRDFHIRINNLFDTQLASMYLGAKETGLDAVLNHHFGIRLNKAFQKKNWAQRPLPPEMMEYASGDVLHLIPLAKILKKGLKAKKRLDWVEEDCRLLSNVRPNTNNEGPLFLRFKGAGRLKPRQLAVLEALLQVRDTLACEKDRPHFKVLSNTSMLKIANEMPTSLNSLQKLEAISAKQFGMYGKSLVSAVRSAGKIKDEKLPVYPKRKAPRLSPQVPERIRTIKSYRDELASRLEIDPTLLMNKALMTTIAVANPQDTISLSCIEELKNWQIKTFGTEIIQQLKKLHQRRKAKTGKHKHSTST